MALDGIFLRHIKKELEESLLNSKVDKIYQPFKDELILSMRSREGSNKLLISARANSPRINITSTSPENPKTPPMLCMLLRKRLSGARLRAVRQPELERLLMLEFEATNELGDTVMLSLAVEIMGQYSNIVFIDENGIIIDAVKRVDASMSSQRLVLPGMKYEPPPKQAKMCILEAEAEDIIKAVECLPKPMPLSKALLAVIQGISPVVCRELEYLTGRGADVYSDSLDEEKRTRLSYFLKRDITAARDCSGMPYIIIDQSKKPIDFTFEHIQQYGSGRSVQESETFSELLDRYYAKRDAAESIKSKSEDLTRVLSNAATRLIKKIYVQNDELKSCADREYFRICGDLLQANLYRIQKGAQEVEVENFYDENLSLITIKLEPALSPSANAQKYYKKYQKAKTAEQVLKVQIERAESELDYVSSVFDSLSRAETVRELDEIREELTEQGYLKARGKKQKRETALPPLEFRSKSGFTVLVGRNNKQNDRLTLKQADKNDIWFHAKDIPGSHTVIVTGGREPDEDTMLFAAQLAAYHSKAREAGKVPVDFTKIRYVSKPQGSKPGMVIYVNQQTMYVSPKSAEPVK
ncbi:MAG: NFACT family protein [Clostridia bacterium]|nr:NFACT family protein [Clostridia bacterium]